MAKKSTKKQNTPTTSEVAKTTKPPKQARAKKQTNPKKRDTSKNVSALKTAATKKGKTQKMPEPAIQVASEKTDSTALIHSENVVSCRQLVLVKPEPQKIELPALIQIEQPQHDVHSPASSDDANALYILGIRYSTGRDVDQDLIAAHKWFNLAVIMGHEEARTCRADISREMSKAQIAQAQKDARAWLDNRDKKNSEGESAPAPMVKRPIYVRRRAQAMRSAQSFARLCACA
jgi:uncharacterized protein